MTQYLITTFVDVYGQIFTEATKARDNQTFTVVEADSKEEAIKNYNLYAKNRQIEKPNASVNQ
ncbi:DUF1381 domain-containing protein [Staphylococcus pseudintermedius]|uniref:DUF1381 domain-containing protein n=1 Tax=Staphylococcus pseudintermedius TaxID=283734 RepID=UPI001A06C5BA|nr:DUF1381 domain-containing protein [Staphylococcus pseudintermedius]EGQ2747463.1 DUF1381 domain-containing protein [Staphylococcus pseudintermedius]EGQ3727558.1 DUF1381 domain-containing protein [Staphylococcus pseudintermedius]EHT8056364.1 DUF1381 domain-containing protein [Staphylococcus pseudintermedius]EJD8533403.1 DUF1381 domain-containing protein [Staphylococcus pseudintermedius]MDT0973759.1 DUF1381 domain-containing protein [Staphylococcus pseudintermedius]